MPAPPINTLTLPRAALTAHPRRVKHPDWLHKRVRERDSKSQQLRLDTMFAEQREKQRRAKAAAAEEARAKGLPVGDIEDMMGGKATGESCEQTSVRVQRPAGISP